MLSVIIPALNEEQAIRQTVESIQSNLKSHDIKNEIIVINDGSTDRTHEILTDLVGEGKVKIMITHPQPGGYGLSLKDGIRASNYSILAITDADGTYPVERIVELYTLLKSKEYDMVVGARTGSEYRGTFFKMPARRIFLWLSEYATGQKIDDINSGLRVFKKEIVVKYMHTISNGFSFTTTLTLASLLNGYFVRYIPIPYYKRVGKSHIRYWRDSLRSLQIIIENILFYNPLKLFLLIVNCLLMVSGFSIIMFFILDSNDIGQLFGMLSVLCIPSALIVGAIGLMADLFRIMNRK